LSLREKAVAARPSGFSNSGGGYVPAISPVRPGALDAFNLPSLVNGQRVQRKLPGAMTSRVSQQPLWRG
jgi:hypothetical protein